MAKILPVLLLLLIFTLGQNLSAQTAQPSPEMEGSVTTLDLSYVHDGDYTHGRVLEMEDILAQLQATPLLEELNLSGQPAVSPELLAYIHDALPSLKRLTLKGSIRFDYQDGMAYSSEMIIRQEISVEMLQALLQNHSTLEVLDLSLSSIDDTGLNLIGTSAQHLKELYLVGNISLTEEGLESLIKNLPQLKVLDLSKVFLRQPHGQLEEVALSLSPETLAKLREGGLIIILNERTPWF